MKFDARIWNAILNERDWMLGLQWVPYYDSYKTDNWEQELEPERRWYWTIREIEMMICIMRILEERSEHMYYC